MLEIIPIAEYERWETVIRSFAAHDVYYLPGYARAFQLHGEGEPLLLYYEDERLRAACAVMKRKIAQSDFFDYTTPYGYGGFIFEGDTCDGSLERFGSELMRKLKAEKIVSFFVRFHPQLNNAAAAGRLMEVQQLGPTVEIELTDNIRGGMSAACRVAADAAFDPGSNYFPLYRA